MYRKAYQAGSFYPGTRDICIQELLACIAEKPTGDLPDAIVAGIVPHAGWTFSGPTAGKVYCAISQQQPPPDTFIVFGAVHVHGVNLASLWKEGKWETPIGDVEIDSELAESLLKNGRSFFKNSPESHSREHSIEVQIPFIKFLFPDAKIVPVMVPPDENACEVGEIAALQVQNCKKKVVAIGSTDMTHYGSRFYFTPAGTGEKALEWVKNENDKRMLELITSLQADKVVDEAMTNYNACGSGAIAATVSFARAMKRKAGKLLEYTTSYDVHPERNVDTFVAYAAVVF